jgi:putative ABC transport system permease protein
MTLITVANVFNTITTSVSLRRREFAMLKSVGITSGGLNKMMAYECLFYGLTALAFALPVSGVLTRVIFNSVTQGIDVKFVLPWGSIGVAVAGVFGVVFVTMMYAIGKVKRENTVEALKNEML